MDIHLEEGEISDSSEEDGINPYTPLERPIVHFEPIAGNIGNEATSMEEDAASSSEIKPTVLMNSDSETDDEQIHAKRLKLSSPVKNKYSIWNKDPNGDLTDFLNQVGMEEMPTPENSRNVENYPLPFLRSGDQFNDSSLRPKRRKIPKRNVIDKLKQQVKKLVRNLDSLQVNESNTIEEVAEDITKKLKEYNEELMLRIVIVLGKSKAIELYEKTRVIEKLGGMPILNGSRKRTSGGVFIFLVRSDKDIPEDKLRAIFEDDKPQQKKLRNDVMNKIKKKRKKKNSKNPNSIKNSSELSNPPPSPDLPDESPREDTLNFLF